MKRNPIKDIRITVDEAFVFFFSAVTDITQNAALAGIKASFFQFIPKAPEMSNGFNKSVVTAMKKRHN